MNQINFIKKKKFMGIKKTDQTLNLVTGAKNLIEIWKDVKIRDNHVHVYKLALNTI